MFVLIDVENDNQVLGCFTTEKKILKYTKKYLKSCDDYEDLFFYNCDFDNNIIRSEQLTKDNVAELSGWSIHYCRTFAAREFGSSQPVLFKVTNVEVNPKNN